MEFWVICLILFCLVIVGTRITGDDGSKRYIQQEKKVMYTIIPLFVAIGTASVCGIIVGKWIGNYAKLSEGERSSISVFFILTTIIGIILAYIVGYGYLRLFHKRKQGLLKLFTISFVVSIIVWSILIWKYNLNVETTTQTIVEKRQERTLLYFCNIPVQEVSGDVLVLGRRRVSVEITTSNNLTYWYLNKKGEGQFDSASAQTSKIIFIEDKESPYVEIVEYITQTTTINHNNGKEKIVTDKTWKEYNFYLPKAIMQYNLN